MGNETENKSPSSKGSAVEVAKEKFQELAPTCRDKGVTTNGDAICMYHDSSATDCRFSICPKLDFSLQEAAKVEKKLNPKRWKLKLFRA